MMKTGFVVLVLLLLSGAFLRDVMSAQLIPLTPDPSRLRFRLVGDEPIAGPDGASTVTGSKVLVFRDMKRGDCYVAFVLPTGTSAVHQGPCSD